MRKTVLFVNSGSGNHGCEAIVRSIQGILNQRVSILSNRKNEDIKYGLDKVVDVHSARTYSKYSIKRYIDYILRNFFKDYRFRYKKEYEYLFQQKDALLISIGGDSFCTNDTFLLEYLNNNLSKRNTTVLWGCSIEPDKLQEPNVIQCLNNYSLIVVRDPITYRALKENNINTQIVNCPDPAFQLKRKVCDQSELIDDNTIGLNISNLIIGHEMKKGSTFENYIALVQHILDTTDMNIALIPHVVWENVGDIQPLKMINERFKGSNRVMLINDHNCEELKDIIARCRMFIGARTHSTIAAYSSCVPTLVVGYSVKAKGIAESIFGTYENYVIPVQSLEKQDDLINSFEWLKANESSIREHLNNFMPKYCEKAKEPKRLIEELINGDN